MEKITVSEFDKALHAGLGRCVLFLDVENKEPYRESVLQACLNDYAYDSQSEGTRAWYTYRLLSCFNDDEFFFSRVQNKLREVICWMGNSWEFEHLFDLVLQFSRHGHSAAKQLIQEIYGALLDCLADKTPEPDDIDYELQWLEHICIEAIQVGGLDVFVKIAADLGALFKRTDNYNAADFEQFVFLAKSLHGNGIISALSDVPDPDGNIVTFVSSIEQNAVCTALVGTTNDKQAERYAEHEGDQKCDVNKILSDIKQYDNTDPDVEWHGVAMEIAYNEDTVFPIEAYMYVYTGSCACCRYRVVRAMRKHGLLTAELLRECQFDCYEQTRDLAERIIQN